MSGMPSWISRSGRKALPDFRERSEALPDVRECSRGSPGSSGVVERPSWMS